MWAIMKVKTARYGKEASLGQSTYSAIMDLQRDIF